jgi:hypothetical protein
MRHFLPRKPEDQKSRSPEVQFSSFPVFQNTVNPLPCRTEFRGSRLASELAPYAPERSPRGKSRAGDGDSDGVDRRGTWQRRETRWHSSRLRLCRGMSGELLAGVSEAGVRGDIFGVGHDRYRHGSGQSNGQKFPSNLDHFVANRGLSAGSVGPNPAV